MIRGTDDRGRGGWATVSRARAAFRRLATMAGLVLAIAGPGARQADAQIGVGSPPPALPGLGQPPGDQSAPPPRPDQVDSAPPPGDNARYRFIERYTAEEAAPTDGQVGAYRVAFWETSQTQIEANRGAPERTETTLLVKTTERPVLLGGIDRSTVQGLVRRYDSVQVRPDPRKLPSEPTMLAGRTLWLERNRRGFPLVLAMTSIERPLMEEEFRFAAFQNIFMPDLVDLLPEGPVQVGGTWGIAPAGAQALLGTVVQGGALTGKLLRIEPAATPGREKAILSITGRVRLQQTVGGVNAELEFEFAQPEAALPPGALVSARGAIVRLGMTVSELSRVAREGRTVNASRTRQIVLERRLAAAGDDVLEVPAPIPTKTVQNSWVRSVGQDGLFRFDHPQEYLRGPVTADEVGIHLMRDQPGGPDDLMIEVVPTDRTAEDKMVQTIVTGWGTAGVSASKKAADWLPEANWPGLRVYRAEFELTSTLPPAVGEPVEKAHMDAYQIRFQRDATAYVRALTTVADPTEFREEVEEIIRTITLERAPAASPAPAAAPAR